MSHITFAFDIAIVSDVTFAPKVIVFVKTLCVFNINFLVILVGFFFHSIKNVFVTNKNVFVFTFVFLMTFEFVLYN